MSTLNKRITRRSQIASGDYSSKLIAQGTNSKSTERNSAATLNNLIGN